MQYLAKYKQSKLNCDEKRFTVSKFSANRSFCFTKFLVIFLKKNMAKIIRFCKNCYFGISNLTFERAINKFRQLYIFWLIKKIEELKEIHTFDWAEKYKDSRKQQKSRAPHQQNG